MAEHERDDFERLATDLEAAALRALKASYDQLNLNYFHGKLRAPALEWSDARGRLGRWVPARRALEVARWALTEHGWGALVEVLKHEMAHQFVDEVLGLRDEAAHGPTFRRVCDERGIDARAAGAPVPGAPGAVPVDDERSRVLERVAKLLALAQSPDLHEAESAMGAAQRLMLKYNLDAVTTARVKDYCYRHLGDPAPRVDEWRRVLANIVNEHFFVETIWVPVWSPREGRRAHALEVCGSRENVEMAEYVHSFLTHTAQGLWGAHKRARKIRGDRDRRAYIAGVMAGFREKLVAQRRSDDARGLVWVGDADLTKYFRRRHPRVRTVFRHGSEGTEAHGHGREAGRNIVLHKGVNAGGSSGRSGAQQLGPGTRGR